MSLFRSDIMGYFSLVASKEYAWDILNEIGELECLQFLDKNAQESHFRRPYSNFIKRCEDLESKIATIESSMSKFELPIYNCENSREFLAHLKHTISSRNKVERTYLDEVEAQVNDYTAKLNEQIKYYETLIENFNHLVEYKEVLLKTRPYIQQGDVGMPQAAPGVFDQNVRGDIRFTYLAGVINKEDSLRFRKILFRITRGMTYTALIDIARPANLLGKDSPNYFLEDDKGTVREKTVFLVVYQGGEHQMLKGKLDRICDAFGASKYGIPINPQDFERKIFEVEAQINDAQEVVKITRARIGSLLQFFSDSAASNHPYSNIEFLRLYIQKEKALYHNLNMLQPQNALYIGNCWCPIDKVPVVQGALQNLARVKGDLGSCEFRQIPIPDGISPPTHFRTNDVTFVFQQIVDTYGVPRYREINPGLFAIATFPFLFGVMFGDVLHGGLLFAFGLYLCLFKEKIEKDKGMLAAILPGRYLLAFQGFFAFYCGFIYNDFTSIPLNIFGTCYETKSASSYEKTADCNYPLGIDPYWFGVSNELTFLNSFKMKLAIILGVAQMLFGILLRGANSIFSRKWLDFFFEFVPMIVFMTVTFGYMAFLIVLKWSLPWNEVENDPYWNRNAPSIINIFIKMALSPGKWDKTALHTPLYGDSDGQFQATVQLYLMITAVICALLILYPKPFILKCQHKNRAAHASREEHNNSGSSPLLERSGIEDNQIMIEPLTERQKDKVQLLEKGHDPHGHGHGGEFDFGEVFVHQIIETIEFVLGSISNTASYLRLWALSLAHSQLAKVFYDNTIARGISGGNPLMAFFGYWMFANVTFGVLMLMDQMECFLHALRLHWVEFQNKFYKADGYAFTPFSFAKSIEQKSKSD